MTRMADFAALARGKSVVVQHSSLPDTDAPGVSVSALFNYQSYFDSTLLAKALLTQSKNEPIVARRREEVGGYSFGLHPSSQAPIAILPRLGNQPMASQAIVLKPGQVYRPHGRTDGKAAGNFSGFDWGLPFGWLGGGLCTLYVFPSSDAEVRWPGDAEVIFHRQRMQIVNAAGLPANAPKNWPLRFPWTQALRGSASADQKGAAVISISRPTRVMLTLRLGSLAAANTMRIVGHETNDFGLDSTGAVIAAEALFDEFVWGTYAVAGGAGNLSTQYPVKQYDGPLVRLAADDGGVTLQDMTGDINAAYVDVTRYGRI